MRVFDGEDKRKENEMEITVVSSEIERIEMLGVIDAYGRMADGKMSKTDFNANVPTKVYIDYRKGEHNPWLVVDNRGGECYTEDFATLDGALLYATDCHFTTDGVEKWDMNGAAAENMGFVHGEDDEDTAVEWPESKDLLEEFKKVSSDDRRSKPVKVHVHDINWDTDGREKPPTEVTAEIDIDGFDTTSDAISEWLSNEYGYLTFGFSYKVV